MNREIGIIISIILLSTIWLLYKYLFKRLNMRRGNMAYAQVAAKQDRDTGWGGLNPQLENFMCVVYRVTFELVDCKSVQLEVPKKVYESVSIGSRGVLVYDVNQFRAFHVDKKISDIVKKPKKKTNRNISFEEWLKDSAK